MDNNRAGPGSSPEGWLAIVLAETEAARADRRARGQDDGDEYDPGVAPQMQPTRLATTVLVVVLLEILIIVWAVGVFT